MERDKFIFRCDIVDRLSQYNDEKFGKIIKALSNYVRDGEIPTLEPELLVAFNFIKVDIDKDMIKYQEKCEKNRKAAYIKWQKDQLV